MRARGIFVLAMILSVGLVGGVDLAVAGDREVERAFRSQDKELARLKALGTRKFNRFADRKFRRPAPVLRITDEARRSRRSVRR